MLGAALLLSGCARQTRIPETTPQENLLSIATEFQLLAAFDPYRNPPGRDLTGQNIARATLVRLANYRSFNPNSYTGEIAMLEGRALELLGSYGQARERYGSVAAAADDLTAPLPAEAIRRMAALDRLFATQAPAPASDSLGALEDLLLTERRALSELAETETDPFYAALALREQEQRGVALAELLAQTRALLDDGDQRAIAALEDLLDIHMESHRFEQHQLRLARFHGQLAAEEARLRPPESAQFDASRYERHFRAASDVYYELTQADGTPEKLLAEQELAALLAFGEYVARRAN